MDSPVGSGPDAFDVPRAADAEESIEAFVAAHWTRLVRLSVLVCRNLSDAEDAVQTALERAWRARRSLDDDAKLRPWLDKIVIRETIRLVGARRQVTNLWLVEEEAGPGPVASDVAVRIALTHLTPEQRAAVVLHLYAGHTVPETARILDVPVETVRSRLRVAREHLRGLLAEGTGR